MSNVVNARIIKVTNNVIGKYGILISFIPITHYTFEIVSDLTESNLPVCACKFIIE